MTTLFFLATLTSSRPGVWGWREEKLVCPFLSFPCRQRYYINTSQAPALKPTEKKKHYILKENLQWPALSREHQARN